MGHAFFFRHRRPAVAATMIALSVAMSGLAGCGRRGPLELPPGAPQQQATNGTVPPTRALEDRDQPGLIQSPNQVYEKSAAEQQQVFKAAPAPPAINGPDPRPMRFLLDPLL